MERVGVLSHPSRDVDNAIDALRRWTDDRRLELVQIAPPGRLPVAPSGEVSACDLIAAVGGDGTVLNALHAAARTGTPVIGVACGSLGALTAVPASELIAALDRFATGDWLANKLPALELGDATGRLAQGINDLVLSRRGGTQLIVDVSIDGELYVRLAGDGVVVATPLGSSAYSMAAGGPLLAAGTDVYLCTPLAMHGGCAPPLVLPQDRALALEVHPGHGGFGIEVDGAELETDAADFTVRSEDAYVTLVGFEDPRSGLTRLRERGLIRDSPRVIATRPSDFRRARAAAAPSSPG